MSSAPASNGPVLPGWFGKLPSLGDFASRRLDPAFIECWDSWLADGILALRQQAPSAWLDAYLQAPSCCFLLMPGSLPGPMASLAWAGVLMPSVDRVGRYFPFTLVLSLTALPSSAPHWPALWPWLGRLDDLTSDALQNDWTVDRLEAEIARLGGPELAGHALDHVPAVADAAGDGRGPQLAARQLLELAADSPVNASALWSPPVAGRSYWLASAAAGGPRRWVCAGLPVSAAALLGG